MALIEARLADLGLTMPPAFVPPAGVALPFVNVRVIGNRAIIAGHGPQGPDGSLAGPLGKVGREVTLEQGYAAAKLTALSMLSSLQRALGDLDRVTHWVRIFGMVNSAPASFGSPRSSMAVRICFWNFTVRTRGRTPAARWEWRSCRSGCRWRSRAKRRSSEPVHRQARNAVAVRSTSVAELYPWKLIRTLP